MARIRLTSARHIALLVALTNSVAFSALAVPTAPNGSFSGALTGGSVQTDSTGGGSVWKLGVTTTQINITSGTRFISGYADPYLGATNNLLITNGGPVNVGDGFSVSNSLYNVTTGTLASPFNVSFDGFVFDLTSEVVTAQFNGDIGLAFIGTLTGAPAGYLTGSTVDFSIGFTESSPTGAIGVGYSLDTPINSFLAATLLPPSIPEPATLPILVAGLVGLVAAKLRAASRRGRARG